MRAIALRDERTFTLLPPEPEHLAPSAKGLLAQIDLLRQLNRDLGEQVARWQDKARKMDKDMRAIERELTRAEDEASAARERLHDTEEALQESQNELFVLTHSGWCARDGHVGGYRCPQCGHDWRPVTW